MQITIAYDSSWRNSFLDGDNNEPLPKKGRKYKASITNLKQASNYMKRNVTLDTVMGVLNRLIGDQRKLYQSREDIEYYFKEIEKDVFHNDLSIETQEMTYLRNISGSTDQNSFTGAIKSNDEMFESNYSKEFWSILALDLDELINFIIKGDTIDKEILLDPISIMQKLEEINKIKAIPNSKEIENVIEYFVSIFGEINYFNKKNEIVVISLYCSALYIQLERLSEKYDMETAKTKAGGISGISKRGFTKKDFMNRFTTGDKKRIWGNPYIHETFVKGEGKTRSLMTKASGKLEINIDISKDKAKEIRAMIRDAGVSSFYLGKKGLAYVEDIKVAEIRQ